MLWLIVDDFGMWPTEKSHSAFMFTANTDAWYLLIGVLKCILYDVAIAKNMFCVTFILIYTVANMYILLNIVKNYILYIYYNNKLLCSFLIAKKSIVRIDRTIIKWDTKICTEFLKKT